MIFDTLTILQFAEHFKPEIETSYAGEKHCDVNYTVLTPYENSFYSFAFLGYKKRRKIYINMIVVHEVTQDEYLDAINENHV